MSISEYMYDSESEDEDELIDMRGEREECSQPSRQEEEWREYTRTWSEPITTLLPKQEAKKRKERMSMEQTDELLKSLEFVTFPELEEDEEDEWTVKKCRRTVSKERIEREVYPVENATKEENFAEVGDG